MALWSNEVCVFAEDPIGYCVENLPSLPVYLYSEHMSTAHCCKTNIMREHNCITLAKALSSDLLLVSKVQ